MSADGKRVIFPDGDAYVTVDVAARTVPRFPFQQIGQPAGGRVTAPAARGPGGTFEVVAGDWVWRLDPASGDAEVLTDRLPSPGGWRSDVELSRSPDGRRLIALTRFGLFELQADRSWRFVNGKGLASRGIDSARVVWSPDSNRVAFLGDDLGIVVVGLDGSGAYELVKRDANGRLLKVLDWLPDGRIVYAVVAQGL